MFKSNWIDSASGVKTDELGFKLVDLKRIGYKFDSFILASQANTCIFIQKTQVILDVMLHPLSKTHEDHINENGLGDITLNCSSSNNVIATNAFKDMEEDDSIYIRINYDDIGQSMIMKNRWYDLL